MSLMDHFTQECVMLTKTRVDDPLGGYKVAWVEGTHFQAAWEFTSAPQMTVAEQQGVGRVYRIYTDKTFSMNFHDVFRRLDNGQTYRVTNPGTDRHTPATSRLNKRLIEVELWNLPREEG